MDSYIICDELTKLYKKTGVQVMALSELELSVERGEFLAIIGKSGSGKSTLMDIIAGLTKPTTGKIVVDGIDLSLLDKKGLVEYRKNKVGLIRQSSARNLLGYMKVRENLEVLLRLKGMSKREIKAKTSYLLELVGLKNLEEAKIQTLSGGECQRLAIALALSTDVKLILADEPTGALDSNTADEIISLLRNINKTKNVTIIMVTHDKRLAEKVDRVVRISDGKISSERLINEKYQRNIELKGFDSMVDEEYSVLDKAGRIKLNEDVLLKAGINSKRVKVVAKAGRVIISPEEEKLIGR